MSILHKAKRLLKNTHTRDVIQHTPEPEEDSEDEELKEYLASLSKPKTALSHSGPKAKSSHLKKGRGEEGLLKSSTLEDDSSGNHSASDDSSLGKSNVPRNHLTLEDNSVSKSYLLLNDKGVVPLNDSSLSTIAPNKLKFPKHENFGDSRYGKLMSMNDLEDESSDSIDGNGTSLHPSAQSGLHLAEKFKVNDGNGFFWNPSAHSGLDRAGEYNGNSTSWHPSAHSGLNLADDSKINDGNAENITESINYSVLDTHEVFDDAGLNAVNETDLDYLRTKKKSSAEDDEISEIIDDPFESDSPAEMFVEETRKHRIEKTSQKSHPKPETNVSDAGYPPSLKSMPIQSKESKYTNTCPNAENNIEENTYQHKADQIYNHGARVQPFIFGTPNFTWAQAAAPMLPSTSQSQSNSLEQHLLITSSLVPNMMLMDKFVTNHLNLLQDFVKMNTEMAEFRETWVRNITLEDTRKYMEQNRPKARTFEECLEDVRKEELYNK